MADTITYYRFLVRGGTAADLAQVNEIPLARELIVETDAGKIKLGNGITRYNDLPYLSTGGGGGDAASITYDNTDSGLAAVDVQAAITELASLVPMPGDPLWDQVQSLLHFDAGDGVTALVDEAALFTWDVLGSAKQSAVRAKFGPTSADFSAGGAYAPNGGNAVPSTHPAYIAAADDFTVEMFVWEPSGFAGYRDICVMRGADTGLNMYSPSVGAAVNIMWYENGAQLQAQMPLDQWVHLAAVRKGGQLRIFINGVPAAGSYASTSVYDRIRLGQNNGGAEQFYGSVDEFRLTKAARYDTVFDAPVAPFPNTKGSGGGSGEPGPPGPQGPSGAAFNDATYHLLHMDGANGSTVFINVASPALFTRVGTPVISTEQFKFGGASARFNGGNDALRDLSSPSVSLSDGDFTVECFYREEARNTTGANAILLDNRDAASSGTNWALDIDSNGVLNVYVGGGYVIATSFGLDLSRWYHIALTRFNRTFRLFVDGQLIGEYFSGTVMTPAPLTIGGRFGGDVGRSVNGFVDEYRLSKGVARYVSAFSPPTAPFDVVVGPPLPAYTVATLPSAAVNRYVQVYVTDLANGAEPCISDGSVWRRLSDRSAAS